MDKSTRYYTTGEFAKLCGVNKKTLFHYDTIGLLKPEKTASNGYRYYSTNQLELFSIITILKDLEMPLKEIRNFLDSRNPDNTIQLFRKEKLLVENKISELKRIQKLLDVKLKIIEEAQNCPDDIILQYCDEETIVLSNLVEDTGEVYDVNTFAQHIKYCNKNKLSYGHSIGSIIKKNRLINMDFMVSEDKPIKYDYYFTKVPNSKAFDIYHKKTNGTYVIIYHHGYYNMKRFLLMM